MTSSKHYKSLSSLQQYVLVSYRDRSIEVWTREHGGSWILTVTQEGGVALLATIDVQLDVRDVYEAAAENA